MFLLRSLSWDRSDIYTQGHTTKYAFHTIRKIGSLSNKIYDWIGFGTNPIYTFILYTNDYIVLAVNNEIFTFIRWILSLISYKSSIYCTFPLVSNTFFFCWGMNAFSAYTVAYTVAPSILQELLTYNVTIFALLLLCPS